MNWIIRLTQLLNPRRAGTSAASGTTILTITNNGSNLARVTTAAAHGRSNGQLVALSGNSVAGYNGNENTVTVVSATVFDLDLAYISDGTGGTWALA